MRFFRKHFSREAAQTAIELTIFGAILMFVLAIIVRQAFSVNFGQNQQLRAMRIALSQSYRSSKNRSPAHNFATILIVEDRLTPSTGKYGPVSRTPFAIAGSGTHSNQLFQPQDFGRMDELPRFDIVVNGQHFQLTTAGYRTLTNLLDTSDQDWDPACAFRYTWGGTAYDVLEEIGCRRMYMVASNYVNSQSGNKFCCEDCPGSTSGGTPVLWDCVGIRCCNLFNLPADERFDLDRDNTTGAGPPPGSEVPNTPLSERSNFSWQWFLLKAIDTEQSAAAGLGQTGQEVIPYEVNFGEPIFFTQNHKENITLDIDRDLQEEFILNVEMVPDGTGRFNRIFALDQQWGDIDLTTSEPVAATGLFQGLQDDMKMYTFTEAGTFLQIDEGEMFGAGRFVRSIQKRNRIDIVERAIQLNADTNRFCDGGGNRVPIVDAGTVLAHPNPVEVCNECFRSANVDKTCYEESSNIIYVRSRIREQGGRKWVTPAN